MDWTEFALALGLFTASHFVPRLGDLRGRLIARVGRRAYFSVYGVLSLALLVWVVSAAGRAPYVELWPQTPWTRWVPNVVLPASLVLAAIGMGVNSPFTLGGRRRAVFAPSAPGLAALSRHPLFLALALWAGAHLFPNGDLAYVIVFGIFTALPVLAIPVFDARARRTLGDSAPAFFAATRILSLRPLTDTEWRHDNARVIVLRAVIGLVLWVVLFHLHGLVIGVSPMPI